MGQGDFLRRVLGSVVNMDARMMFVGWMALGIVRMGMAVRSVGGMGFVGGFRGDGVRRFRRPHVDVQGRDAVAKLAFRPQVEFSGQSHALHPAERRVGIGGDGDHRRQKHVARDAALGTEDQNSGHRFSPPPSMPSGGGQRIAVFFFKVFSSKTITWLVDSPCSADA